jgi:hypothetical protein
MTALVQNQPVRKARRGKVQRVRSYGKPSWDDDSCHSYDYSMSSYEAEQLEHQQREQRHQQFMRLLAGKLDCPHARSRHRKRIPIYTAEIAKLTVQSGAALETQWGDMPTELMEIIASHLHPCDIGRLRGVSSGWRAAFWQEHVVRASLRGCGPQVDQVLMIAMFKNSGSAWKQICDQMDVWRPSRQLRAVAFRVQPCGNLCSIASSHGPSTSACALTTQWPTSASQWCHLSSTSPWSNASPRSTH